MNHPHRSARWQMTAEQLQAAIDALTAGNQSEFARLIGVDGRTVRYWLAGTARIPRPAQILVKALQMLTPEQRATLTG